MDIDLPAAAELFRQLAFTSALVGGSALAFVGALLAVAARGSVVDWTVGVFAAAAAGMFICVLGWSLGAATVTSASAEITSATSSGSITHILSTHRTLSLVFIPCIFLFLVGLGLSGWIRSHKLGMVTTVIAFVSLGGALLVVRPFVR